MIKNILIVDDDEEDVELFCEAIKDINLNVVCNSVSNGREALKLLQDLTKSLPDYIFLDMNMPKMSGTQCLIELKKNNRLKHIDVIMFSTSKQEEDIKASLRLGAAHYFTKPSSFKFLKQELALFLK